MISSSSLALIFKNLEKRNPTTKEKALDSLQAYLDDPASEIEESVLLVWVRIFGIFLWRLKLSKQCNSKIIPQSQFYPRLTAEFSRKVRQSAHKIQGELCKRFQKLSVKYMKESIGCWLGGLYDSDRQVSRSAKTAFESVFASQTKRENVFKIFHAQILEYIKESLSREMPSGGKNVSTAVSKW